MKTTGRYEIREVLGEGGMGVVYRAFDPVMGREVTLKTIRNPQDKTALDLFKRECQVLASMAHPNIVEIHDVGEVDEPGGKRPYFVMPLLRGVTLDQLIKSNSTRLTVERSINIMSQICRGLQAAHEQGLVHRDLKPSNIFILEDDSVKVIDFGVAHLVDQHTATGLKGTLLYMAPEQLLMKPPTPISDQFSIAVVCYEMLAHRHPFSVPGYKDPTQAILTHTPPPVCDVNHSVNRPISQVVHKALAKEPFNRFSNVREFAECLQKAMRNERIEFFDPSKIEPRMQRARKAMDSGDLEFANEILRELEAESYLDPEIGRLRSIIDQTQRAKTVKLLLDTARRRFEEEEYLLALQKVQEVLNIDPANTDAFTLKGAIESKRSMAQVDGSLKLAQQHIENHAYDLARKTIEKVLQLRPKDTRAQSLLAEADRREQESLRIKLEKEKAYQAAMQAFGTGEVSAALSKLERVLELDRRSTDNTSPEQSSTYQKMYEEVRSKRDQLEAQYAEAKKNISEGNLDAALAVCEEVLKTYPNNVIFHSLKYDIEEAKREEVSTYIAKVEKEVAAEPDLNRKVSMLEAARQKYPQEERFLNSLERVKSRRDLVQGIVGRATALEDGGQFAEALSQWEILRNTYPQYPGLDVEIERLKHRREQQSLSEAKGQWAAQIDQALALHNYARAASLADEALAEFQQDPELMTLKKSAQLGLKRSEDAQQKFAEGQELVQAGRVDEGFACLREASRLDPQSQAARNAFVEALLQRARALLDSDWKTADGHISEAQELDPGNPLAKSLRTLIQDRRDSEEVTAVLSKARELQAQGQPHAAITELDGALAKHPGKERLMQLRTSLVDGLPENERSDIRVRDLEEVRRLASQSEKSSNIKELDSILAQTRLYTAKYADDTEFLNQVTVVQSQLQKHREATVAIATPPPAAIVPSVETQETPAVPPAATTGFFHSVSAFFGTMAGRVVAAIALLVLGAAVFTATRPVKPPKQTEAASPALAKVTLSGQTALFKIADASGQDVTEKYPFGLAAGTYTLTDSKAGFKPVSQQFTVDPPQHPDQTVTVAWQQLPVNLVVQPAMAGSWKIDNQPLTAEQLAGMELPGGAHELSWGEGPLEVKLPVNIADGKVEVGNWTPAGQTNAVGLAVKIGREGGDIRRLNVVRVRYQTAGGTPVDVDADGPIQLPAPGEELIVQAANNGRAVGGKIATALPADRGGLLYVFLAAPRTSVGAGAAAPTIVKRKTAPADEKATSNDTSAAAAPSPPQPPKLTPEEEREKARLERLKKLGISPDDIKGKAK